MYKAVFFDLDNTLYDYDSANEIAVNALYEEFIKESQLTRAEFLELYEESKEQVKRKLIGTAASHERILYLQELVERVDNTFNSDRIMKMYHAYWDAMIQNSKLFDDVIETLQWLNSNGVKIVIITNLTTYVQIRKINELGLSDYIDYVVTSQESGYDKPHPTNFLLALNKTDLLAKDVLMVGDNLIADIEGAQAVGINTVLYEFGKQKNVDIKPDHVVKSYKELQKLLGMI